MPKLKTEVMTGATLEQYLAANDDFSFEIACLRALQKFSALSVAHAGTYSDPVTNKSRQFDFRVECRPTDFLKLSFAIECKNLRPNFPLVISRLPRLPEESFHHLLLPAPPDEGYDSGTYRVTIPAMRKMNPSRSERIEAPQSPYAIGEMVGKATTQVGVVPNGEFFSDDSEVYEKWAQAVSSAYELISQAHWAFSEDEDLNIACLIVPVVVVPDGVLWVKDYRADGTPVGPPTQIDEATFFLNHSPWSKGQTFSYTISHLHFVTRGGLDSFISRHFVNSNFHRLIVPVESSSHDL